MRSALTSDATSANDLTAVSNLNSSLRLVTSRTSDAPNNSGSAIEYLDVNNSANDRQLTLTSANAKALGLLSGAARAVDATISFSSSYSFDFNPDDGISLRLPWV